MVISVAVISYYLCFQVCLRRNTKRLWQNQLAKGENGYQCSSYQLLLVFPGMFVQDHKKNVAQSVGLRGEGKSGCQCSSYQLLLVFPGMFALEHKKNVAESVGLGGEGKSGC